MEDYEMRRVRGHIEVFANGKFLFSADNLSEAEDEIRSVEHESLCSV